MISKIKTRTVRNLLSSFVGQGVQLMIVDKFALIPI